MHHTSINVYEKDGAVRLSVRRNRRSERMRNEGMSYKEDSPTKEGEREW